MKSLYLLCFCFLFLPIKDIDGQDIPVGTWRTHLSYQTAMHIAATEERIYVSTQNALFYYDREDASLNKITKIDGLSDIAISALGYHSPTQTLLITYQNGNIDLFKDNTLYNLPLIKSSSLTGNKNINHILFSGNTAYLSTAFGMAVLDMQKRIILDTYQNLGIAGVGIEVYSSCIAQDSIFISTSIGVQRAKFTGNNLKDFNNWLFFIAGTDVPSTKIPSLISRNNAVYLAANNSGIYQYDFKGKWNQVNNYVGTFSTLQQFNQQIFAPVPGKLIQINASNQSSEIGSSLFANPMDIYQDKQNTIWVADYQNGLVANLQGSYQSYLLNGPARADIWKLFLYDQNLYALSGGMDSNSQPLKRNSGFYLFQNGNWTNYNAYNSPNAKAMPDVKDLLTATYNPKNGNVYFASFGKGILVLKPDNSFDLIDQNTSGSPLRTSSSGDVRITGLAVSSKNDLWISNPNAGSTAAVHVLKSDQTWASFVPINTAAQFPMDILIDNNSVKWILLNPANGGGIWLLDEVQNKNRYLSTSTDNGGLPSNSVYSISKDQDGLIWVGTGQGVAVFYNPSRAFTTDLKASLPIYENKPLLRSERINAIAVDGGNRKWIATQSGAWLFNADGTKLIQHFTAENSPLLSNNVLDIKINGISGEVFFATDQGIISYRADATENKSNAYNNVKVFPNPVTPGYQGFVTVSGLLGNVEVKITDLAGHLVFQAYANGGSLAWNLNDYNGQRVKSGIYLVFASNKDGSQAYVTKFAVVD